MLKRLKKKQKEFEVRLHSIEEKVTEEALSDKIEVIVEKIVTEKLYPEGACGLGAKYEMNETSEADDEDSSSCYSSSSSIFDDNESTILCSEVPSVSGHPEETGYFNIARFENPKKIQPWKEFLSEKDLKERRNSMKREGNIKIFNLIVDAPLENLLESSAKEDQDLSRLSHPDIRKLLTGNREESRHTLAHLCRAPIASLDCMEEFQGLNDHVSTAHSESALVSRQSSIQTQLKYKPLGKSGLRVSQIGLGTWVPFSPHVPEEVAEEIITTAYESGINVFDLSEAYSANRAEVQMGNLLKKKNWKRTAYHIVTKVYWNSKSPQGSRDERGLSRKHIIESVRASLERLQLDYVDIIIIHRADDTCPMEEVVRAASHCIDQGWCMYWGTSRWSPVEIMEAWTNCRQFNCMTPIVEQTEYHMFCRGKTELYLPEMYNKIGVGAMGWSPLALGLISGKIDNGVPVFTRHSFKGYTWLKDKPGTEEALKQQGRLRELGSIAEKIGCTITQLSIAWCLKNENLHCVLVGASTVEQLLENINSMQVVSKLKPDILGELERILDNKPSRPPIISTMAQR